MHTVCAIYIEYTLDGGYSDFSCVLKGSPQKNFSAKLPLELRPKFRTLLVRLHLGLTSFQELVQNFLEGDQNFQFDSFPHLSFETNKEFQAIL